MLHVALGPQLIMFKSDLNGSFWSTVKITFNSQFERKQAIYLPIHQKFLKIYKKYEKITFRVLS